LRWRETKVVVELTIPIVDDDVERAVELAEGLEVEDKTLEIVDVKEPFT
jgi:hypothetical protein